MILALFFGNNLSDIHLQTANILLKKIIKKSEILQTAAGLHVSLLGQQASFYNNLQKILGTQLR